MHQNIVICISSDQAKQAKHCIPKKILNIRIQMNKNICLSLLFLISALRRSETLSSTNITIVMETYYKLFDSEVGGNKMSSLYAI